MNVALLIENLEFGGSEAVVQRLALGLAHRRHHVLVYCLRQAGIPTDQLQVAGVTIREARAQGRSPLLLWRLARWLRQDRIDVVQAHCCAALVWAFPVANLLGLPLVHVWHGWPPGPPTRHHRLAQQLARFVDRVGVNSESLRDRLPKIRAVRQAVHLPNGVDCPPTDAQEARHSLERLCGCALDGPVILSVGNVRVEKDTRGLLRAFAQLRRQHPQAHLVCVGLLQEPEYWEKVERDRQALDLVNAAHFPGPSPDAWRLMAGADVFCLSSSRESMPNVILEAMSQRVPIVATTVGDVGRLDGSLPRGGWLLRHDRSALLVPPGDPDALAKALARTLHDPVAAQRRAASAFEDYQRRFTTAQMVQRYERLYAQVRRSRYGPRAREAGPSGPAEDPRHANVPARLRRPAVLMLGPPPTTIGGMVTSIELLMRGPLRERFALHRFAVPGGSIGVSPVSPGWHGDVMRRHGTRRQFHRSPLLSLARRLRALARHTAAAARLAALLVRRRIDLVHIHTCSYLTFYRNLVDLAIARMLRRTVVLHIRGGHFGRFCAQAGRLGGWLIRRGLRAADAVIVLSQRGLAELRPYTGRTPVFVVPNAVNVSEPAWSVSASHRPEAYAPVGKTGTCRFLYLAALTEAKGLADLLRAAAILRQRAVPFELVIAGPATDEPQASWEERAHAAGLADVTTFTGPVTGPAKARLLATADCFVHPSHVEALPNAVLEAAAAGLPVIATAVGGVPALMKADQPNGPLSPLVPPRDPVALADQMERLAADPPLRARIGAALRGHVEVHYSLARVSGQIAQVYHRVLEGWDRRNVSRWGRGARRPAGRNQDAVRPHVPTSPRPHVFTPVWAVRNLTYPLHERLRGRPTLREYQALNRLAAADWQTVQLDATRRLRELLLFAADRLPYYAELFVRYRVNPRADDPVAELRKLPIQTKADVRANTDRMTWPQVAGGLQPCSSGGTTGDTLYFWVDRRRQAQDLGARLFVQGLFGIRPGERRVHLWGSPLEARTGRLKHCRDWLLNERLLDAFDLSPVRMDAHLLSILRFRPSVIYGYTSAVALLARHAVARYGPQDFPWLRLVVLTGEEVTPDQVAQVRQTFGCPVAAEYGNREVGLIAHQCPQGRMHILWPHIHVDIVAVGQTDRGYGREADRPPDEDAPRSRSGSDEEGACPPGSPPAVLEPGQFGEVICTTLNTRAQPFLRYRVGDAGRLLPGLCPCGLPLPVMRVEGGKIAGLLALPDGRLCHGAVSSHALHHLPGIITFRTHQRRVDWIEVLLVVNGDFRPESIARIQQRYRRLLGPQVRVDCRIVDHIPPDPSGKRRHVISDCVGT